MKKVKNMKVKAIVIIIIISVVLGALMVYGGVLFLQGVKTNIYDFAELGESTFDESVYEVSYIEEYTAKAKQPTTYKSLRIIEDDKVIWFHPIVLSKVDGLKFYREDNSEIVGWNTWQDLTEATQYSTSNDNIQFSATTTIDCSFDKDSKESPVFLYKTVGDNFGDMATEVSDYFKQNYLDKYNLKLEQLDPATKQTWMGLDFNNKTFTTPIVNGIPYSTPQSTGFWDVYDVAHPFALSMYSMYPLGLKMYGSDLIYYFNADIDVWDCCHRDDYKCCAVVTKVFK